MSDLQDMRCMLREVYAIIGEANEAVVTSPSHCRDKLAKAQQIVTQMEWELTLTEAYWRTTRPLAG